jgi:hypothetical protein
MPRRVLIGVALMLGSLVLGNVKTGPAPIPVIRVTGPGPGPAIPCPECF